MDGIIWPATGGEELQTAMGSGLFAGPQSSITMTGN